MCAILLIASFPLFLAPTVPITLRLLVREELFHRGPFHLGRWSKPVAAVAFCWAVLACVLFILPQVLPVTAEVGGCWTQQALRLWDFTFDLQSIRTSQQHRCTT
jgi:hypothetical protein